jgi:hypothetical protein
MNILMCDVMALATARRTIGRVLDELILALLFLVLCEKPLAVAIPFCILGIDCSRLPTTKRR